MPAFCDDRHRLRLAKSLEYEARGNQECTVRKKQPVPKSVDKQPTLSERLEAVRYLSEINSRARRQHATNIQHIAEALIEAGYKTLDRQAKALGIHRATAWPIIKHKHKVDRLNSRTRNRILANPELPACVRDVIRRYVAERPESARSKQRMLQPADKADEHN